MAKLLATIALACMSCSVAVQSSVRSSRAACDTTPIYVIGDVVIAGGMVFVASTGSGKDPQPAYVPVAYVTAAVFAASAGIGLYKRHNCANYREAHKNDLPAVLVQAPAQNEPQADTDAQPADGSAPDDGSTDDSGNATDPNAAACPDGAFLA